MFLEFFLLLKNNGIPVSLKEHLTLLEALSKNVVEYSVDDFYALSRSVYVKHEQNLDRFDVLFGLYFQNLDRIPVEKILEIPEEWLKQDKDAKQFTQEEKDKIEAMGGMEEIMERLRQLLEEQKERHEGGDTFVGTQGTSPFGAQGYNPKGIRFGKKGTGGGGAAKVWENRSYKNLKGDLELDTRTMKMALRRLRILTREGIPDELDLDKTIQGTSRNGGVLDIRMQAAKKNRVKVLLLMDVGGSMDSHVRICEQLFSAARHEFKHMEYYYFHNCLYESVWKDNRRRFQERIPTLELMNKYNQDYKLIFIGDATMAPYEITSPQGSVEHYNEEAGIVWLHRMKKHFPFTVWINPTLPAYWDFTPSIEIIRDFTEERMFPMTIDGLTQAMKALKDRKRKFDFQSANKT